MKKKHLCLLLCMFMLAYCIYAAPIRVERRDPDDQTYLIFSDEDGNIIKEIAVARYVVCSPSRNFAMVAQLLNPPEPPYPYGGWWDKPISHPLPTEADSTLPEPDFERIDASATSSYIPPEPPPEEPQARPAWEEWKRRKLSFDLTVYDSTGNITGQWEAPQLKIASGIWEIELGNQGQSTIVGFPLSLEDLSPSIRGYPECDNWLIAYDKQGNELVRDSLDYVTIAFTDILSNNYLVIGGSWINSEKYTRNIFVRQPHMHYYISIFNPQYQQVGSTKISWQDVQAGPRKARLINPEVIEIECIQRKQIIGQKKAKYFLQLDLTGQEIGGNLR